MLACENCELRRNKKIVPYKMSQIEFDLRQRYRQNGSRHVLCMRAPFPQICFSFIKGENSVVKQHQHPHPSHLTASPNILCQASLILHVIGIDGKCDQR